MNPPPPFTHLSIHPHSPVPPPIIPGVAGVCWNLDGSNKLATPATPSVLLVVPRVNGVLGEVDVVAKPVAIESSATPTSLRCLQQLRWAVDVAAKRGAMAQSATPTAQSPSPSPCLAAALVAPGCSFVHVAPPSFLLLLSTVVWDEALARAHGMQAVTNPLVGEQAGSLPHPEQSSAAGARGSEPAVPARSSDGEAALDDVP